jgi:capsular polysaccharide biosynthesis protein
MGNIGFQEITIMKNISQISPSGIPGYNVSLLLGIVSTITSIFIKKRLNSALKT